MSQTIPPPTLDHPGPSAAPLPEDASSEQLLAAALREWQMALDVGLPLRREELLAKYAAVRDDLSGCLDGLDLVREIAAQIDDQDAGSQEASLAPHVSLGDFRILREIGRGGMGIVYEAEQLSLGRKVALKVLPFAGLLDKRALARFQNEARAAATLEHPNIVPVYAVGDDRSVHYYAMRLIRGASLAEVIAALRNPLECGDSSPLSFSKRADGKRIAAAAKTFSPNATPKPIAGAVTSEDDAASPEKESGDRSPHSKDTQPFAALSTEYSTNPKRYFRRVAEIGIQIAQALHHAHEHGILHRDVKPANILLGDDGKAWITDFGLARLETADASITASGDLLGTLRYMSPEQTDSRIAVDSRSDVYSLGATLYEALTLRPVFTDTDRPALLRRIAEENPTPPRRLRPEIPADLETIVQKTLAKDPHDRYASAAELAADLRRFLDQQPIRARRASPLARVQKWGRRHIAAVLGVSVMLALSLTIVVIAFAQVTTEQNAKNAEQQEKIAALDEAQANLQVAVEAVDELYTNFAVQLRASETVPSYLQQQFLKQAADFYRRIIERPANTPRDLLMQATAHFRIGELERYLENYDQAVGPLEKSVEMSRRLRKEFATEAAYHDALSDRLLGLGYVYRELQDFEKTEVALREALGLLKTLPDGEDKSDRQTSCKLQFAHVKQRQGKLDEALRLVEPLRDELMKRTSRGDYFPLPLVECRYRIASILLDQDRLAEARQANEDGLGHCRAMQLKVLHDSRSLLQDEINFVAQAGDIAAREGNLDEAIGHYRASLELQLQAFKVQKTPEEFCYAKESTEMEPGPFCRYMEIQLRLADVIRRAGRPYDAQEEVGSCALPADKLAFMARPHVLRYEVLHANVYAMAARLAAAQGRPEEVQGALGLAATSWRDVLKEFPRAAEFASGVHGREPDLDWFQRTFPGKLDVHAAMADPFFVYRATGGSAFRAHDWHAALKEFESATWWAQKDHVYDWLHIAMAHAHLGHAVQARNYLEAAVADIASIDSPPPDLLRILDHARGVVDTLPLPELRFEFDGFFVEPQAHGLAAAAQIRVGPDGNVYVASHDTDVVKVFASDTGELLRDLATSGGELDGPLAMIFGPDGRLYVGGRKSRNVVRFLVQTGDYEVFIPSQSGGLGVPKGLAFGPDGDLYISSSVEGTPTSSDTVKRYNGKSGAYLGDFVAAGSGGLDGAAGLAFGDDNHLYVASANSGAINLDGTRGDSFAAINVYDGSTGQFLKSFASGPSAALTRPSQIEFPGDGFLYVTCGGTNAVKRLDANTGTLVELLIPAGTEVTHLLGIHGFALDDEGRLYVSATVVRDEPRSCVLRYQPARPQK